ncbi:MAG: hypothetical protein CFE44_22760 [Burkholderiales bacterium PBB4]|nr:MAG: hypothetical protein CFE44_22760 [Burkholderiales bacterium PBB4]
MKRAVVPFAALVLMAACASASGFCFDQAAERYGVDPKLLVAIAKQESGLNPRAINYNRNGSADYGLMQINSENLASIGLSPSDAMEPCLNVHVGAWILARFIRAHGPTWRAVGAYNAGSKPSNESLRANYAAKVAQRFAREQNKPVTGTTTADADPTRGKLDQ